MLNFIAIHLQRTLDIQDYASLSFFETQCYTTAMQVMRTTTILHYFMRSSCSSFKTSCFLLRSVLAASDPFCNIQHHSITLRLNTSPMSLIKIPITHQKLTTRYSAQNVYQMTSLCCLPFNQFSTTSMPYTIAHYATDFSVLLQSE